MKEYRNKLGQLHRLDGPAIECDGDKEWWVNGTIHRTDGLRLNIVMVKNGGILMDRDTEKMDLLLNGMMELNGGI